jgi:ABC-type lipoprotein release transport system permease subunit
LYAVSSSDVRTAAGVLGVIAGVTLVDGYLPARRATAGDCVELLRQE